MCSTPRASTAPGLPREMIQIVLPMVAPGLVATIFISIIFAWNEFFLAFNLAPKESTVPMFMVRFVTSEGSVLGEAGRVLHDGRLPDRPARLDGAAAAGARPLDGRGQVATAAEERLFCIA